MEDLLKHIRFCARALAADRSADIILPNDGGCIPVRKRKFKTKPDCIELQFSSGHLGQQVVQQISAAFEERGIKFKSMFSPKRKTLSRITTSYEADDVFTPKIATDTIGVVCETLSLGQANFSIEYHCDFEEGCVIEDGDPVKLSKAYKLGEALGRPFGSVAKLFK